MPLVVDPVMVASSGAKLLEDDAVDALVDAAVSARDGRDAEPATRRRRSSAPAIRPSRRERLVDLGARGRDRHRRRRAVDHFFDGETHARDPGRRHDVARRTAPAARTRRRSRRCSRAARTSRPRRAIAAATASDAVAHGLAELGAGEGPVDVFHLEGAAMSDSPGAALRDLRERKPLIHQITNYVVMNETANATLAIGALPVMAHARRGGRGDGRRCRRARLNIGTLSRPWIDAMLLAGKAANAAGVPVVLDPVGVGATTLPHRHREADPRRGRRRDRARERGRVAALAGLEAEIRGVEAIGVGGERRRRSRARRPRTLGVVAAVTGPVDHVSDGDAHARRRERRSAARDDHRLGLHVDRAHRLLRSRCGRRRSTPRRSRSPRSASRRRMQRVDATRPRDVPRAPLRRALRARRRTSLDERANIEDA